MSQDNQITLRGFVTAEPRFQLITQDAIPVTEIRVGCTPQRLNRTTGEWEDLPTSYYTVKCWRRLAINASSSLHKGDRVVVRGRFSLRRWVDDQQQTRERIEIEADSLGHDLTYGWSHFLRGSRPEPGQRDALNAGEAARQDLEPPAGNAADDSAGDDEYLRALKEDFPSDGDRGGDGDSDGDRGGDRDRDGDGHVGSSEEEQEATAISGSEHTAVPVPF
jgi:single-strand DNA-binding protein